MSKLYFIVGSQDLYGEECLKTVADDARQMAEFFDVKLKGNVHVELLPTVRIQRYVSQTAVRQTMMMTAWALSHGCTLFHLQRCGSRVFHSLESLFCICIPSLMKSFPMIPLTWIS